MATTTAGRDRRRKCHRPRQGKWVRAGDGIPPPPLTADQGIPSGGTDTGPNPYDLLVAALGACKWMTVAMYARLLPVHRTLLSDIHIETWLLD